MTNGPEHSSENDIPPRSPNSGQEQTQTETIPDESSHVSQSDLPPHTDEAPMFNMDIESTSGEYGRPSDALIIEQRNQIR